MKHIIFFLTFSAALLAQTYTPPSLVRKGLVNAGSASGSDTTSVTNSGSGAAIGKTSTNVTFRTIIGGVGITCVQNTDDVTCTADTAVIPFYSTGAGAPSATCTEGQRIYLDTTGDNLYYCSGTDTWTLLSKTGHAHSAADVTSGTLALARGGTNQTSWTASRCVQVNADGTALESAGSACGSGGGTGGMVFTGHAQSTSLASGSVYYLYARNTPSTADSTFSFLIPFTATATVNLCGRITSVAPTGGITLALRNLTDSTDVASYTIPAASAVGIYCGSGSGSVANSKRYGMSVTQSSGGAITSFQEMSVQVY